MKNICLAIFNHYLKQNNIDEAKKVIQEAYKIRNDIDNVNKKAIQPLKYIEDLLKDIEYIQFNYENLNSLEYESSKGYLLDFSYYFDLDINNDGNIDGLGKINSPNRGNIKYEIINDESNFIRITNNGELSGLIYIDNLKL